MSNKSGKKQKLTKAQQEAKRELERQKQLELAKKKARQERFKKAGIVLVCVILVLALGIPTVALSLLSGGGA